ALVTGFAGTESPAARDGVRVGDIILRLDEATIKDMGHLMRVAGNLAAGKRIVLDMLRGNERLAIAMTVGDRPEHLRAR
ncbi:MAG: PDZ domain-containing protein, partial [Planctomycetaceae bacterium]